MARPGLVGEGGIFDLGLVNESWDLFQLGCFSRDGIPCLLKLP
jgi:hypothetical protein